MQYDVSGMQNTSEEHKLLLWCEINVRWKKENGLKFHNDNFANHPDLIEQTIEITSVLFNWQRIAKKNIRELLIKLYVHIISDAKISNC